MSSRLCLIDVVLTVKPTHSLHLVHLECSRLLVSWHQSFLIEVRATCPRVVCEAMHIGAGCPWARRRS